MEGRRDHSSTSGDRRSIDRSLWLHGRSCHTQRAYRADARKFPPPAFQKPLRSVTLWRPFKHSRMYSTKRNWPPASRKPHPDLDQESLLVRGHRVGLFAPSDVARVCKLPPLRDGLVGADSGASPTFHRMIAFGSESLGIENAVAHSLCLGRSRLRNCGPPLGRESSARVGDGGGR